MTTPRPSQAFSLEKRELGEEGKQVAAEKKRNIRVPCLFEREKEGYI